MAVAVITVYGLIHLLPGALVRDDAARVWLHLLLQTLFWAGLFFYGRNRGALRQHRVCRPVCRADCMLALWGIPVIRVILYGLPVLTVPEVLSCVFAVLGEEVAFRAWLPGYLRRRFEFGTVTAALLSSGLFGLLHMANLLSGTPLPAALLQSAEAFCAGLALYALAETRESILPCVLLHFLINITAPDAPGSSLALTADTLLAAALCAVCAWAGLRGFIKKENTIHETLH